MTSAQSHPGNGNSGPPALILEITGQEEPTPLEVPVLIQNLSMGGITLVVINHWGLPDWERLRGRECVLRWSDSGGHQPIPMKAKIIWSRFSDASQSPLSLGLQLLKPPGEALKQLSAHLAHTSQDIKEFWEQYDQVHETPRYANLMHQLYIGGLALLLGGVAFQFIGSPTAKMLGWVFWLLGSLAIVGKVLGGLRQKRASQ